MIHFISNIPNTICTKVLPRPFKSLYFFNLKKPCVIKFVVESSVFIVQFLIYSIAHGLYTVQSMADCTVDYLHFHIDFVLVLVQRSLVHHSHIQLTEFPQKQNKSDNYLSNRNSATVASYFRVFLRSHTSLHYHASHILVGKYYFSFVKLEL